MPDVGQLSRQEKIKKFSRQNQIEAERINEGLNESSSEWSLRAALCPKNADRNRYSNVFPWDRNRVKLPVHSDGSDYMNASYVTVDNNVRYIAAQGPLKKTIHHFWAMCFNEADASNSDTVIIAMVTPLEEGGIKKCEKYWPEAGEEMDLSRDIEKDAISLPGLKVSFVNESFNELHSYVLTEFELSISNKLKRVLHYYYYKWADAKVPPSSLPLIDLAKSIKVEIEKLEEDLRPAPIIHCSAGVGRTGTFIALDQLLNYSPLSTNKFEDPVERIVSSLRSSRMMMVQTVYQYLYLYEVLTHNRLEIDSSSDERS